jgi:3-(3-hydroxy-phenyl)propionate hydroxylase
MVPGAPAADAPVKGPRGEWLLEHLGGEFALLTFGNAVLPRDVVALAKAAIPCRVVQVGGDATPEATRIEDAEGLVARRYDGRPGTVVLLRPDQHVAARWRAFDAARVRAAMARATCND